MLHGDIAAEQLERIIVSKHNNKRKIDENMINLLKLLELIRNEVERSGIRKYDFSVT